MALMLKMFNVMSHADPYLHVHHPSCLLCMSTDVILAGWQETFRSTASWLAPDLKVSCQLAGRRHFLSLLTAWGYLISVAYCVYFSFDSVCEDILPTNFACPKGR